MIGRAIGWLGVLAAGMLVAACSSEEGAAVDGGTDAGTEGADGSVQAEAASSTDGAAATDGTTATDASASADTATSDAGTTADGATGSDAASLDSGAATGGDGSAAACNTVTNVATMVTPVVSAGTAPTLAGGTIADGTYVETSIQQFGGTGVPAPEQSTIQIKSGQLMEAVRTGGKDIHYTSTFTAAMNNLDVNTVCDSSMQFTGRWGATYQATPTTFVYSFESMGGRQVKTYTKQ